MAMTEEEAIRITSSALSLGVTGDLMAAGLELLPLIEDSYGSAYALAAMLAETASHIARREQTGDFFDITVENTETGESASVDSMPPDVAFAAQFVTAWANRDHDTCDALFVALVKKSQPDGPELVDGLLRLFQMAVVTSTEVVAEQRRARTAGEEPTP